MNECFLLSVGAVARRLGASPSTVWRWMQAGVRGHRLEARLIGARWRTSEAALDHFLAALNSGREPVQTRTVAESRRASDAAGAALDRIWGNDR